MSPRGWLRRVGQMDRAELLFRVGVAARQQAALLGGAWRSQRWQREALAPLLSRSAGPLDTAVERLEARDWNGAHEALAEHFHRRVSRFPVSPHALPEIADRIRGRFPHAPEEAARRAERIASGRLDLLGYRDVLVTAPSGGIDWHRDPVHDRRAPLAWWSRVRYLDPALGDHKIIWELNRHQHFLALGRAAWLTGHCRYRDVFVDQLEDWLHSNPPLVGINWASMLELSLRSLSWVWALHFFVEAPEPRESDCVRAPWLVDLLLALDRQLGLVEQNLSRYFSPNTHLTGEALGLYVCGRAVPELRSAGRWADTGRDVLLEQIDRQILADGGHVERSTHYQRYTLDFYLLALVIARVTEDPCADRFAEAVGRLAHAARVLADDGGRLPLIGDDDGGSLFPVCARPAGDIRDSLASAAVVLGRPALAVDETATEETMWLLGNQPDWLILDRRRAAEAAGDPIGSVSLAQTGYYVSRPRPGDHVVIDGGPHGFLNGGHAHADALSLTATLSGRSLLIDPGTATYTMSAGVRDRFRSSPMHNTLTLDGRSQSIPGGPFHWRHSANANTNRWMTARIFDYFEGVHDGYLPAIHRRRVLVAPGGPVVVVDSVLGDNARHVAEAHWHLAPDWRLDSANRGVVSVRRMSGERAWFLTLDAGLEFLTGDSDGVGWCSPSYGAVERSTTLRMRVEGSAPLTLVTLFGAGGAESAPRLRRLPAEGAARIDATALELDCDDASHLLVFGYRQPVLPDGGDTTAGAAALVTGDEGGLGQVRAGGLETDARLLWLRRELSTGALRVAMLDGRYARDAGTGVVLVSSDEREGLRVEDIPGTAFSSGLQAGDRPLVSSW